MGQFAARVLTLLAADGQTFDSSVPQQGRRLAEVDDLYLHGHDGALSRLLITLTARAGSVARRENSGECSQRLCWNGDVPLPLVRTRLWRNARRFDWRLYFVSAHIKDLSISAQVDHIERLSGTLEAAFGAPVA